MLNSTSPTLKVFQFHIEWAGASLGFSETLGLGTKNVASSVCLLANQQCTLTLSRGLFLGTICFKSWLDTVATSAHDLTIYLHDEHHQIAAFWVAKDATLAKHVAALALDENTVVVESLQVQHAGLTLGNP